jgi:hypothetical protein
LSEEWAIVPIYKKGDKTHGSNYRGISLLPTTYKILSNILLSKLTSSAEKLLGIISVDFDATAQLLAIYATFFKYLRKNGNNMKQCISNLWNSRKLIIQLGGRSSIIFSLSLVST